MSASDMAIILLLPSSGVDPRFGKNENDRAAACRAARQSGEAVRVVRVAEIRQFSPFSHAEQRLLVPPRHVGDARDDGKEEKDADQTPDPARPDGGGDVAADGGVEDVVEGGQGLVA